MSGAEGRRALRTPRPFILLYALAYGGLFMAFIPFFTLLLPLKVEGLADEARVSVLSLVTLSGAIVASLANVVFGDLSDRTMKRWGSRRPWIGIGLAGTIASYAAIYLAQESGPLVAAVCLYQLFLNMMFAPLTAIMADEIPDEEKGRVAGLLGAAQPLASIGGVIATLPLFAGEARQYAVTCLMFGAMVAPFLLLAREPSRGVAVEPALTPVEPARNMDLALAWGSRLLVQVAGSAIVSYLFFYLRDVLRVAAPDLSQEAAASRIALTIAIVTFLSVASTIGAGWLSDRMGRRKPLLAVAGFAMPLGLVMMATASAWVPAAVGYALFGCGYAIFLALHAAFAMQLLPSAQHRGRDLGILNLTNTIPAATAPLVVLALTGPGGGLAYPLLAVALLSALGALMVLGVRSRA